MNDDRDQGRVPYGRDWRTHQLITRGQSEVDVWLASAKAFVKSLVKQLAITLMASSAKKFADWLLSVSDKKVQDEFLNPKKPTTEPPPTHQSYGSYYTGRNHYPAPQRYESDGSDTFPGFNR